MDQEPVSPIDFEDASEIHDATAQAIAKKAGKLSKQGNPEVGNLSDREARYKCDAGLLYARQEFYIEDPDNEIELIVQVHKNQNGRIMGGVIWVVETSYDEDGSETVVEYAFDFYRRTARQIFYIERNLHLHGDGAAWGEYLQEADALKQSKAVRKDFERWEREMDVVNEDEGQWILELFAEAQLDEDDEDDEDLDEDELT